MYPCMQVNTGMDTCKCMNALDDDVNYDTWAHEQDSGALKLLIFNGFYSEWKVSKGLLEMGRN